MTQEEQESFLRTFKEYCINNRRAIVDAIDEWAKDIVPGFKPDGYAIQHGLKMECRTDGQKEWELLTHIKMPQADYIDSLFDYRNREASNHMGDVIAVRCTPYYEKDYQEYFQHEAAQIFPFTNTGERRQWNHLSIDVHDKPTGTKSYGLDRWQIKQGDNICWYKPWHFDLNEQTPCPVAPIIVEQIDEYGITLRYRDQLFTLSREPGKQDSVLLEKNVTVHTNENYTQISYIREKFVFSLEVKAHWFSFKWMNPEDCKDVTPEREVFMRNPKKNQTKDHDSKDMPKTREQIDHDAWQYAVDNDLIPHN